MARKLAALLGSLGPVALAEQHWAVLIAGSKDFWNYRHQADVCHAYHVLIERGFHPERIITMLYDDVAHSRMNPFPGQLFNYPWKTLDEAVDVYTGCRVDYRGDDVTPEKFLAVLRGDQEGAGGKVLRSGADDHVFVNFVDHGDVGIVGFPHEEDVLHAKALTKTLVDMHRRGMYRQLVFYLESCNSGSMFEGLLPKGLPVYAMTAASPKESSWAAYCGSLARVGGRPLDTCLGDVFSVSWMGDSDRHRRGHETLDKQFKVAKALTNKSKVMRFGEVSKIGRELVGDFQGTSGEEQRRGEAAEAAATQLFDAASAAASAFPSRDAKLEYLRRRSEATGSDTELRHELRVRAEAEALSDALVRSAAEVGVAAAGGATATKAPGAGDATFWTPAMADCHERAVAEFGAACGWKESRLRLAATLYRLCDAAAAESRPVLDAIRAACPAARTPQAEIWA